MASSRAVETALQVVTAAVLLSLPLWAGDYSANQIGLLLLYGMATQGVALCWGNAGFLPLGQSLFFGLGAYVSALVLRAAAAAGGEWQIVLLPLAVAVPAALAYAIGLIVFARRIDSGPFFSLITLASCMLGFLLANQWSSVTGGFNGLTDIPDLPMTDRYGNLYYVIAVAAVVVTAGITWLSRRPIGTLWAALSENEDRLQFLGFATHRLKAAAFGLSGAIAGLGGALYAPHEGLVGPQAVGVALSAQFVIWAAVGGKRIPLGAQLGAVVIGLLAATWRDLFTYWEVLVALIFIGVVRLFPDGLAGAAAALARMAGLRVANSIPEKRLDAHEIATIDRRPAQSALLSFRKVEVSQGGVNILNGLDLEVGAGVIHCFIGPNGAGKTSTFNAMTGRLPVRSGEIHFRGTEISSSQAWQVARLGIGRKFQIPAVFARLSVDQNLQIALWANRIRPREMLSAAPLHWNSVQRVRTLGKFGFLESNLAVRAGDLSQGMRQMLEFAMVAITEPRLLLLDEPCAGLSAHETRHMMDAITSTVGELEASAIVIEHDMSALEKIAGNVVVLHQGRSLAVGSLSQIKRSADVKAVYSGGRK
ncbi:MULTISPECIES: ATP-binding cassette domain-containing protein [Burkholderia]|uniref:branched-chain amino acid ABC transporter ATP-binding protein/permease n=1 Tax=Burkholderia TaxID=32008 RepID=UPI000F5AE068|nr:MULTISPECIES: ATP-binding cassette domain-containing protein [Burkholderia]MBN3739067.1 ATP-binding cassette domain-containing protein [Burkholderia sp. Tr-20355]RQS77416.1 ATP-binding cassette domain-containing protein [Burkholderia seminalis]